jgi:uncharacterized protein
MSHHVAREVAGGVTLAVRAQPGAKKTAITGIYGAGESAQLKIAVQAPPVEGRANDALLVFIAETFAVPKRAVELVSGELSRSKVFRVSGVTLASLERQFQRWLGVAEVLPFQRNDGESSTTR